jgi:hypothetical protein
VSVQVSAQACLRVIMQSTTVTAEPAGRAARSDHRRGRRSVRQDRSYPARPVEQSRRRAPGAARSRRVPRKEHEQCIGRHHPAAPAAGCVLCGGLQSTKVRAIAGLLLAQPDLLQLEMFRALFVVNRSVSQPRYLAIVSRHQATQPQRSSSMPFLPDRSSPPRGTALST